MKKLLALPAVLLLFLAAGCAKTPAMSQASAPAPTGAGGAAPARSGQAVGSTAARPAATTARPAPGQFSAIADLADIHFEFDKYDIRPSEAKILDASAAWLKSHADQLVLIEGHCDERGTAEYNVALGERRAKAATNYLVSHGVAANRISVISYGEEHPLCGDHNDGCWTKNRRARFLVKPR